MKRQAGFTLMEVLIALTLTAVLVVLLFAGFRAGIRSWELSESHAERVGQSRQVVAMLRRQMQQVLPVMLRPEGSMYVSAFAGDSNTLRYVAPLSLSTGLRMYLIELSNRSNEPGIWIRYAPYDEAGVEALVALEAAEPAQVAENASMQFEYLGEEGWADSFSGEQLLPRLIALRVRDERGSWPRLVLRVGVQ